MVFKLVDDVNGKEAILNSNRIALQPKVLLPTIDGQYSAVSLVNIRYLYTSSLVKCFWQLLFVQLLSEAISGLYFLHSSTSTDGTMLEQN